MFLLSCLLLQEERSMIRSRNKVCPSVAKPQKIHQHYNIDTKLAWLFGRYVFSASPESSLHSWKENNTSYTFFNAILTKIVSDIPVGGWLGPALCSSSLLLPCLAQVYTFATQDTFEPCQRLTFFFFSHRGRKKGSFLLRKGLDKAQLSYSVTCQCVLATFLIAQQDKCPSSTRGKGWAITHSL